MARVVCRIGATSLAVVLAAGIPATGAMAQAPTAQDLAALRAALERQQRQLQEQSNQLARQQRLIEAQSRELEGLRSSLGRRAPAQAPTQAPAQAQARAQAPTSAPTPAPAQAARPPAPSPQPAARAASTAPSTAAEAAAAQRQEEQRILQTDPTLARVGGVLTPRGALSIEPSFEYVYAQNTQATVNGFSIIPGITFGTVDIRRATSRQALAALTLRYGVNDRLELNARIPWSYRWDNITTAPADIDASPINVSPSGSGIGDIEFGGSYQLNAGRDDWPVFIANLRVKSITGRSPFEVPVFTVEDRQGGFLRGLERELPTGSGFWSVEPGITAALATDPAVFFGGLRYIWNIERDVDIQSTSGGAPTRTRLDPGDGIGLNFGVGFAMNERTSLSFSYDHTFVLDSAAEGRRISGSAFDLGVFNFGLSYRWSDAVSFNLGVGVGATEATPGTRILFRVPVRLNLF